MGFSSYKSRKCVKNDTPCIKNHNLLIFLMNDEPDVLK